VEERPVELHARKPWSGGTVAVEEDGWWENPLLQLPRLRQEELLFRIADSVDAQFQSVNRTVGTGSHWGGWGEAFFAPLRLPQLTNTTEGQDAIRGLKVGKAPGPNGITNRALKHFPISVFSNSYYSTRYFESNTSASLETPAFSILKTRKDRALPSSYRPTSLQDTTASSSKGCYQISLWSRRRKLLRNEQSGFRPKHSIALQHTRLVVSRNFG
jgi:hypothetical protein